MWYREKCMAYINENISVLQKPYKNLNEINTKLKSFYNNMFVLKVFQLYVYLSTNTLSAQFQLFYHIQPVTTFITRKGTWICYFSS